jgi:hypothetical protein
MTDEGEVYYRFDASTWGNDISIFVSRLSVVARTRCGVWLGHYEHKDHFVLNGTGKRYAYPTIEAAWDSYQRRKTRQLGFLSAQHDHVASIVNAIQGKTYDDLKGPDGEVRIREEREPMFFEAHA